MKRWLLCLLVLGIVVASSGCGEVFLAKKMVDEINDVSLEKQKDTAWDIDESRGHYVDEYATPTMTGTQLEAALKETYFTKSGHLCVTLAIYNGTDKARQIDALDAQGFDYATGEQFAGGKVTFEDKPVVKVAETKEITFYIAPEHVMKGEEYTLPDLVYFSIYFDNHAIDAE